MQDFILNAWYMAGWSKDITETLTSRKLLGKAVLLTRDEHGEAIALRDRCPHRFAPLSMGRREGNNIVCGYHGLAFDTQGQCVRNPYSDRIPAGATVERFPVVDRDGIIWAWFGDAADADPALVPDFRAIVPGPTGSRITGYTLMHADYEYGTDNLLDLSHIEFLHTGTFAGNGVIFKGKHSVEQNGNQLHSNWWMPQVPTPPGIDQALPLETVDHWLEVRWDAPASMHLQVGATPVGEAREAGVQFEQAHILTPADVGETHYFWSSTAPFQPPVGFDKVHLEMLRAAFDGEDKPMVEAAYRNANGDFWGQKPVSLGIDAAGARARRIVESLKRGETASSLEEMRVPVMG